MVAYDPAENLTLSIRADGYPPLLTWLQAIFFKFFSHPVFAGRFISVITGALSTVGIYLIGKRIYSKKVGFLASILYIFLPLSFFIDRYAYHDGPMSFFGVYILLFSLLLLKGEKKYQPLYFLCLGVSMGVGVLTKTAAFLMLSFPLLSWFFLKENSSLNKLKLILAAYIFPALSYWWLFSDPYSWLIWKKGRDLSMSFSQLLTFPLSQWWKNLTLVATNWYFYLTVPLLFLLIISVLFLFSEKERRDWLLFLCFLLPTIFFILVSLGRIWFKYLLFTIPPLLILLAKNLTVLTGKISSINLGGFSLKEFKVFKKSEAAILHFILALLLIPSLRFDYFLMTDPLKAPFEQVDYETHLQSIFSGYGLEEVVAFLEEQARAKTTLVVLPHPDIGILYYGLPLLSEESPNLYFIKFGTGIFYYDQNGKKRCLNLANQLGPQLSGKEQILAVMPEDLSEEWPEVFQSGNPKAKLIRKFIKPGQKSSVNIYRIPSRPVK